MSINQAELYLFIGFTFGFGFAIAQWLWTTIVLLVNGAVRKNP